LNTGTVLLFIFKTHLLVTDKINPIDNPFQQKNWQYIEFFANL